MSEEIKPLKVTVLWKVEEIRHLNPSGLLIEGGRK